MSNITPDEVRRIAALANIGLKNEEVDHFAIELAGIMEFVEQLQRIDVDGVMPTDQVTGLVDVWREDEVKPGLSYEDIALNAPNFENGYFKVKRVIE